MLSLLAVSAGLLLSLSFSADDQDMLSAKAGNWWETNPQRGRANNSVVIMRHRIDRDTFLDIWERVKASGSGEPGFYFSNDKDWGTNPCCEIGLRPYQFCNLTEVNVSDIDSQEEYEARVKAAAFIGTLQASYTDFHYLRPVWQRHTEKDALIGVSMTGIASGGVFKLDMKAAAKVVKSENKRVAEAIGIRPAARTTCVNQPEQPLSLSEHQAVSMHGIMIITFVESVLERTRRFTIIFLRIIQRWSKMITSERMIQQSLVSHKKLQRGP